MRREGADVTLIGYAKTAPACQQAAAELAGLGIDAEVIDLRSIKPLDEATILCSARKTGRVVIVHEASRTCGVGAEIAALVADEAFSALRAPVRRLTGPDAPVAAAFPLKAAFSPQPQAIVATARSLVGELHPALAPVA